jgi:hypothetical protein
MSQKLGGLQQSTLYQAFLKFYTYEGSPESSPVSQHITFSFLLPYFQFLGDLASFTEVCLLLRGTV